VNKLREKRRVEKVRKKVTNEHLVPIIVCNGVPKHLKLLLAQLRRAQSGVVNIF